MLRLFLNRLRSNSGEISLKRVLITNPLRVVSKQIKFMFKSAQKWDGDNVWEERGVFRYMLRVGSRKHQLDILPATVSICYGGFRRWRYSARYWPRHHSGQTDSTPLSFWQVYVSSQKPIGPRYSVPGKYKIDEGGN